VKKKRYGGNNKRILEIVAKTRDESMGKAGRGTAVSCYCEPLLQLHVMDAAVSGDSAIICGRIRIQMLKT
jgi:hypothetical protein